MKVSIILSVFFYIVYMFVLLNMMFRRRVNAVKSRRIRGGYFKLYSGADLPEDVAVMGNHFNNQFQVPILFFISVLFVLQLNVINIYSVILCWAFIASRIIHTFIHLGNNDLNYRPIIYATGWFIIFGLWANILISLLFYH